MKGNRVNQAGLCQSKTGEIIIRKPLKVAVAGVLAALASTGAHAQNTDDPVQL